MSNNDQISWASTREKYSGIFGAPPDWQADNDIGTMFRQHPLAILTELERIAKGFADGKIHTPWKLMSRSLDKISGDQAHVDITRDLRIRQAQAWIRNAGVYCTESEVIEELFSERGGGKGYTGGLLCGLQDELGPSMIDLWRAERPRGEAAEAEFLARAARNSASYHAYRAPKPEPAT